MDRLWVRFSLVIVGVGLLLPLALFILRFLGNGFPVAGNPRPFEDIPELAQAVALLPPEILARLQERMVAIIFESMVINLIVFSIISVAAGIFLSRMLVSPLSKLERAAERIGAQDYSQRVTVRGSRELVSVSTAFNQMAARLEESEQLRSNMLADVAHELRNPLHVLEGNLHAILDDIYPLNKEEIARLTDQTRHLNMLVNDLHELAQAEAHQLPLRKQSTDMAQLIRDTAVASEPIAANKNITLAFNIANDLPQLEVDAGRLRQVLNNLLSNALNHTPQKGRVEVTAVVQNDQMQLQVSDTGSGIAAKDLPYVFDRFYRSDQARSRESGNTGLGLAIVKAIVEEHGGKVTARSAGPDQGATFIVSLPL